MERLNTMTEAELKVQLFDVLELEANMLAKLEELRKLKQEKLHELEAVRKKEPTA